MATMNSKHTLLIATLFIVLAAGGAGGFYLYKTDQQEKALQAQLVLDEGIALYDQAKYEEALQTLETVSPGASQGWRLPYFKGAASVRLKDYQQAARYLEEAQGLNSTEAQIPYLLGVVYYKLGDLKLSEGYFAATLELDPSHEQAKGLLGVMTNLQSRQQPSSEAAESAAPEEDQ